ncbi:MAG: glyoxalase [Spartobacteria bacterium]|nr:glyoxalase [Spartobacteria bacterium]
MPDQSKPIDPRVRIGHIHLKVADLERALTFYCDVLGFELMSRYGTEAAFISAGGYHHHIGLNTWESKGGDPAPPATRAFIISPFYIRPEPRWPMPCVDCLPPKSHWMVRAITASAKHFICTTRTKTESNSIGIVRKMIGRARPMEKFRCSRGRWI